MLDVHDLGVMSYAGALAVQQELAASRKARTRQDTLLLVEHPPVITLGRNARAANILEVPPGTEVHHTNRGGDVTFHGPGQLVGYPIVDLAALGRRDAGAYMRALESALTEAIAAFGITGNCICGLTGVWVGGNKIAAMGVHLSRWVTSHGFALNVNVDLRGFDAIVPCGLRDHGVTSMARELGGEIAMQDVKREVAKAMLARF